MIDTKEDEIEEEELFRFRRKKKKSTPTLSYAIYLLTIFAILVVTIIGIKGTQLNNYCPAKEVPCQVLLKKGEQNPYRASNYASYSGWHFSGYADLDRCWVGLPTFCGECSVGYENETRACRQKFPSYKARTRR
ncbi:hypothetical protein BVY03_04865 [bacterium K02(2017)]|nr:hypothetical protein BVY03_04865 [bacterium K02(2017)]